MAKVFTLWLGVQKGRGRGKMKRQKLKIQNIVATTSLGKRIPLVKFAGSQTNSEYNPEQFPGLVLRIKKTKYDVRVFSSVNLVCTGTKSVGQVREVVNQVVKKLTKVKIKIDKKPKINVQNIVASGSVGMVLDLNKLTIQLENTEYEPEQFPGLVYKLPEINATFLLFSNGKLVCTGTKNRDQLENAMTKLLKNLRSLKM